MRALILVPLVSTLALAQSKDAGVPKPYSGHGAGSVSAELLERFAPPPLAPEVTRHIQAMLDVRSPGGGMISNDGTHLVFSWGVTGSRQLWRLDGPQRFPVQLTGGEDSTSLEDVAPDGTWHLVSRDVGGAENPGLYWQATAGGPLHLIQAVKDVQTFADFISDDGQWVYFHSNDQKPDSYAIYRWEKATGKKETIFDREGLWSIVDHRDGRLLLQRELGSSVTEIHEWDPVMKVLTPLLGAGEREEYTAAYGAAKGEVLAITPKLGEYRRLYSLKNGALTPVTPELPHDVSGFSIDPTRKRILYTVNDGGYARLLALDARTYKALPLPKLPDNDSVFVGAFSRNGRYSVLRVDLGSAPMVSYVLDWQTGKLTQWQQPAAPEVDLTTFVRATLETYPSRDGTPIPMLVRRPARCANTVCPVVVEFHGGPEGQATPGFNVYAQLFVDQGYVYIEPNVRGSDGYGKAWYHADDGPKRLQVITDIEDCATFVRKQFAVQGVAPKVAIIGGSYGGYSTLVGMTKFAGAYDVGVSNVGFSNLATFLMNTAPYRRILRINEYGDPEKDKDALAQLSPITFIDRVKGPLLILQGANDPRVPVGEAIQMHEAIAKRGLQSPLLIYADEGHGAQKRGNIVSQLGHTLQFLSTNLGAPATR